MSPDINLIIDKFRKELQIEKILDATEYNNLYRKFLSLYIKSFIDNSVSRMLSFYLNHRKPHQPLYTLQCECFKY